MSRKIDTSVERRMYAESMGRCMNPACKEDLFKINGDIMEKAHIVPYCDTKDNSFENLVILCPNCHTDFDKNSAFTIEEVKMWKQVRKEEFDKLFNKSYETFEDLKKDVASILMENQTIFGMYYEEGKKELWDIFEGKVLSNNQKLKNMLMHNCNLIQSHSQRSYSNLALVQQFILHIDEFKATRCKEEKVRHVLFPPEINSLFGVAPLDDRFMPSVDSIEALIIELKRKENFEEIVLGVERPYIQMKEEGHSTRVYLNDTPRLRQLYYDNKCFRKVNVRFDSLNFALKYIRSRNLDFNFIDNSNLREVIIKGVKLIFIYEYCLSKVELLQISPEKKCVILNLHNWNGVSCISNEAYSLAEEMDVKLLTMDEFYRYVNRI